jgi:hypothetical protein
MEGKFAVLHLTLSVISFKPVLVIDTIDDSKRTEVIKLIRYEFASQSNIH